MAVAGLTRVASSRFGISGPREPDYLEAYAKGEHDLRGSAWSAARDSIEEALRHFANVPALLALRCELAIRQEQRAAAHRDCGLALRSDPESAPVRVAAGLLVATDGELRVAEEHWRRALALAPDARQAWLNLGWLYRARRDRAKLERLGGEYRARFGEALPQ